MDDYTSLSVNRSRSEPESQNSDTAVKGFLEPNNTRPTASNQRPPLPNSSDTYYYMPSDNYYDTQSTQEPTNYETLAEVENRKVQTVRYHPGGRPIRQKCRQITIVLLICLFLIGCGMGLLYLILKLSNRIVDSSCATNSTSCRGCPPGFEFYAEGNKCYKAIHVSRNHEEQTSICMKLAHGAHLAAPLNEGENEFIANIIRNSPATEKSNCAWTDAAGTIFHSYFLAGHTIERNNCSRMVWQLSEYTFQTMNYTNFSPGEPNCERREEFCLQTAVNFRWNDISCDWDSCAICELRLS